MLFLCNRSKRFQAKKQVKRKEREFKLTLHPYYLPLEKAEYIAKQEMPQWLRYGSMEQWQWINIDRFRGEKKGKR
jgi:hypothetical protein